MSSTLNPDPRIEERHNETIGIVLSSLVQFMNSLKIIDYVWIGSIGDHEYRVSIKRYDRKD